MSHHYYSEINLHLVWHTKNNDLLLTPEIEKATYQAIGEKASSMPGVYLHEMGGTENHVHVVVTIQPTVLISDLVGQLKGYSAHAVNMILGQGQKVLAWQTGYGVVTFGTQHLEWVRRYVQNQKEHHAQQQTEPRLERIVGADPGRSRPGQGVPEVG